jgi:hypothetical protein
MCEIVYGLAREKHRKLSLPEPFLSMVIGV